MAEGALSLSLAKTRDRMIYLQLHSFSLSLSLALLYVMYCALKVKCAHKVPPLKQEKVTDRTMTVE
jgi:hypothetical protein